MKLSTIARRYRWWAVVLPCAAFWVAVAGVALGHGPAAWIRDDERYKTADGTGCCGPRDCAPLPDGAVTQVGDAWVVPGPDPGTSQVFRRGQPGVYPSRDARFWACRLGGAGAIRCFFYPPEGV